MTYQFNKPKFMTMGAWSDFKLTHTKPNGLVYCFNCGVCETEAKMTVDHIIPQSSCRAQGMSVEEMNAMSNLRPLCNICNIKKGNKPDSYYARPNYFDGYLNKDSLRVSQADYVIAPIVETDFFWAKPFSNINGKIFLFCQVVGAGKTLGMYVLPFAINQAIKQNNPQLVGAPRVSRMLIITKFQSLRDQIAKELLEDPLTYKINKNPPRVKVIDSTAKLIESADDHDIGVMCGQMLWPTWDTENDDHTSDSRILVKYHPQIEQILSRYELIAVDEVHFAHEAIMELVRIARNNLVFGFTASPIESSGSLLPSLIRMSNFGYRDAMINDGSMKHINLYEYEPEVGSEEEFLNSLTIVKSKDHKLIGDANPVEEDQPLTGLPTVKTMIHATINRIYELDHSKFGRDNFYEERWRSYRNAALKKIEMAETPYLSHAIVVARSTEDADDIANYMNRIFDNNRHLYPRERGWHAMAIYSGSNTPWDHNHPFFYYRNTGNVNRLACRFLVVVDLAIEGMNNRFVNLISFTTSNSSVVQVVQRLGRLIRVVKEEDSQKIIVQAKSHDTMYVMVHEAEKNTIEVVKSAYQFILDSSEELQEIPSLNDFIEMDDPDYEEEIDDVRSAFDKWIWWHLAYEAGKARREGKRISPKQIVKKVKKVGSKKARIKRARQFVDGLSVHQDEAIRQLLSIFQKTLPDPITYLLEEETRDLGRMDENAANDWCRANNFEEFIDEIDVNLKNLLRERLYGHTGTQLELSSPPIDVIGHYVDRLSDYLKWDFIPYVNEFVIHLFSDLGAQKIQDFEAGGRLDKPQVAYELKRPEYFEQLSDWIRFKTIELGHVPEVAEFVKP